MATSLNAGGAPPQWTGKVFDGAWVDGAAGTVPVTAPATGQQIATVGYASTDDIDRAVDIAGRAQRAWAALT